MALPIKALKAYEKMTTGTLRKIRSTLKYETDREAITKIIQSKKPQRRK